MEPLAIAVHAAQRANVKIADSVIVTGAGPMGCLCVQVAKAFGASKVLVTGELNLSRIIF